MNRIITNKCDLYKPIREGDQVIFNIGNEQFIYLTHSNCLTCIDDFNDIIFEKLGMNTIEKYVFASEHYGYDVNIGNWPVSRDYDYEGLTNLVWALYEQIENKEKSPFKPLFSEIDDISNEPAKVFSEIDDISNEPAKVKAPKIKIKYIKGDINSKLKPIK